MSDAHLKQLNEVSHIPLGFPHEFFQSAIVQDFAFSGTLKQIAHPEKQIPIDEPSLVGVGK